MGRRERERERNRIGVLLLYKHIASLLYTNGLSTGRCKGDPVRPVR